MKPLPACCLLLAATLLIAQTTPPPPPEGSPEVFQVVPPDVSPDVLAPQDSALNRKRLPGAEELPGTGALPGAGEELPGVGVGVVIGVEGLIYDFTLDSLRRRVDRARAEGATVIVIELDTYGGQVTSAIEISKYLKSLDVATVAWINDKAYSAGTMIAAACDRIVMADGATLGDSAPIVMGQDLSPTERAKALSPILEEYRDDAQRHGYDFALLQAMCELGIEVYQVQHKQSGAARCVNQSDFAVMVQGADPTTVAGGSGGGLIAALTGGAAGGGPGMDVATQADRGQWALVRKVHDGRSLLTLNQTRAQEVGLSRGIVRDAGQLRQYLGAATMTPVRQTWSEDIAMFLTSPVARGVLIVALLLGGYAELQSPGVGLPGAVALIALALLLGAPFVIGLAEVWHVLLLLLGLALLVIEVLFTPTFGMLGVAGIVMVLAALVVSVVPMGGPFFTPGSGGGGEMTRIAWDRLTGSVVTMLVSLLVSFVGFYLLTRYFGSIPLLNRLMLEEAQPAASNGAAIEHVSGDAAIGGGRIAAGDTGRALTALHPAGQAILDGRPVDVTAVGGWIDPGQTVRVIEASGNRIVVDVA